MDILIFGGQSNMQGQTEGLPTVNPVIEGAGEYRALEDCIIPLKHPVGEAYGEDSLLGADGGGGSLVPSFCQAYMQESGHPVVAIHAARGNTTIAEWQEGTLRFADARKKILAGIEKVRQTHKIDHIYYVWLQGESDAVSETSEEEYCQRLTAYKNALKREFGIEKFGLIKVGYFFSTSQWHTHISTTEHKRVCDETIMRAQERIVQEDDDFVMLTRVCEKMSLQAEHINPKASGHYNNAAMDVIGKEAGTALAKL